MVVHCVGQFHPVLVIADISNRNYLRINIIGFVLRRRSVAQHHSMFFSSTQQHIFSILGLSLQLGFSLSPLEAAGVLPPGSAPEAEREVSTEQEVSCAFAPAVFSSFSPRPFLWSSDLDAAIYEADRRSRFRGRLPEVSSSCTSVTHSRPQSLADPPPEPTRAAILRRRSPRFAPPQRPPLKTLLLLGEVNVGKTALAQRLAKDAWSERTGLLGSIDVVFRKVTSRGEKINMMIVDTPGQVGCFSCWDSVFRLRRTRAFWRESEREERRVRLFGEDTFVRSRNFLFGGGTIV